MRVIQNLKSPKYVISAFVIAVIFFGFNYYFIASLPGIRNEACVPGANLTFGNILFAEVMSLLVGILAVNIFALYKMRKGNLDISAMSGTAAVIGVFTVFCTICTLPIFYFFGIGVSLAFFTNYNLFFKILSIMLMVTALIILNSRLVKECKKCRI